MLARWLQPGQGGVLAGDPEGAGAAVTEVN